MARMNVIKFKTKVLQKRQLTMSVILKQNKIYRFCLKKKSKKEGKKKRRKE
jgi:hypothetical protein